jgi:hypothetical protein
MCHVAKCFIDYIRSHYTAAIALPYHFLLDVEWKLVISLAA